MVTALVGHQDKRCKILGQNQLPWHTIRVQPQKENMPLLENGKGKNSPLSIPLTQAYGSPSVMDV